ncbi:phage head-tail connector protein [Companilactobacillus nodensis]|nr:phage head-tail connector protein [Companilactobacillus nodensis]
MDNDDVLQRIKDIAGFEDSDTTLKAVIELIKARLLNLIDADKVPDELSYIVVDASISRFNRISDEGKTSSGENEVSATWQVDDLAPFLDDIDRWNVKHSTTGKGKVRFL